MLQGDNDIVVAGGMESMSNIPHYLPTMRTGVRLGNAEVVDGMLRDGKLALNTCECACGSACIKYMRCLADHSAVSVCQHLLATCAQFAWQLGCLLLFA